MKKMITCTTVGIVFGFLIGGFVVKDQRPRSVFQFPTCVNCLHPNEIIGMVVAAGIHHAPNWVPSVVTETDKTIVIRHPIPMASYHVVLFPKKDIKNLGDASPEDQAYLTDLLAVAARLIQTNHLSSYRLWTNGPSNQIAAYLHFHLASSEKQSQHQ